jgi:hypothetical protein
LQAVTPGIAVRPVAFKQAQAPAPGARQ